MILGAQTVAERLTSQGGGEHLRIGLLVELGDWRRVWDEVAPVLSGAGVQVLAGNVFQRGAVHEQWERLGWDTFSLGCRTSRDYPLAAFRLRRLLAARRLRLVHAIETIPAFTAGLAGIGSSGISTVFHRQHCYWDDKPRLSVLSRLAARLTDYTLACSQAAGEYAHDLDGVPRNRIRVAYNAANRHRPVSDEELASRRRSLGIEDDAYVVVCVAHMRPEKGLDTLLQALSIASTGLDRPLHGILVGDGPCRAELQPLASATAVPVHFTGHQDDVAPWYSMADVVAAPSRREPFGVVAAEAMSAAKPLVASRIHGLTEVVEDRKTGLLVPPDDAPALAEALRQLLMDREKRGRMGAAAFARFERYFTNEAMVAGWLECWHELLGRPATGTGASPTRHSIDEA